MKNQEFTNNETKEMIAEYYRGIVIGTETGNFPPPPQLSRSRKTQTGDEKHMKNNGY